MFGRRYFIVDPQTGFAYRAFSGFPGKTMVIDSRRVSTRTLRPFVHERVAFQVGFIPNVCTKRTIVSSVKTTYCSPPTCASSYTCMFDRSRGTRLVHRTVHLLKAKGAPKKMGGETTGPQIVQTHKNMFEKYLTQILFFFFF